MILSFGDNEFTATVEYCGKNMHKVTYNKPNMDKPFENFVFNDDRKQGEKDSIEMAKTFVKLSDKKYAK